MEIPFQIAVCEDSSHDAALLSELIKEGLPSAEISLFKSGEEFLAAFHCAKFHLVFMDIYMGAMSGVDTARALRKTDGFCQIVFTTTSREHALDGYSVDAMQYLIKPEDIRKDNIVKVLGRAVHRLEKKAAEVCAVIVDGHRMDIPLRDILYAEVYNKKCHIHILSPKGKETVKAVISIDELETMLNSPRFLRCHRSNIVNLDYVNRIERDFILDTGDIVYIRRADMPKCLEKLDRWRLEEAGRDDLF